MLDSFCFEFVYIGLDVSTFVFDDMDTVSEESLFPCILRTIADVECMDIAT